MWYSIFHSRDLDESDATFEGNMIPWHLKRRVQVPDFRYVNPVIDLIRRLRHGAVTWSVLGKQGILLQRVKSWHFVAGKLFNFGCCSDRNGSLLLCLRL